MNQQPKRILLKKSRHNYNTSSRLSAGSSSSKASDEDNDGWISTHNHHHRHTKRRKHKSSLLVDSSDDDSDNNLLGSNSTKAKKKPRSKFSKKIIGKKKNSWDDDDSSSSNSSDDSSAVEVVNKKSKKKGKSNNNNETMPSKKKQPAAAKIINVTNKQSKVAVNCMPQNSSKHKTAQVGEYKTKKKEKKKKISRASMNAISTAGNRAVPTSSPTSDIDRIAQSKANRVEIPEDITSIHQLQWYRIRLIQSDTRSKECLQPCRILSRGEAAKYYRRRTNNGSIDGNSNSNSNNNNNNTVVIQYLNFPNIESGIYKCINNSLLIPFGYTSKDGLSSLTFNDDYLHRYIQQQKTKTTKSGLQAEKLFIIRIFNHAGDMERKAREMAKCDFRDFHGDGSSSSSSNGSDCESSNGDEDKISSPPKKKKNGAESRKVQFQVLDNTDDDDDDDDNNSNNDDDDGDDEMDDLDMPYTQAITFDPDDFDMDEEEERSNEPIRPGDVIEYYSPIYVAGDSRGLRQSTVLAVDPKDDSSPLVLDNGEGLPTNTKVKRIKVKSGDDLLEHPGIFRPIYKFRLVKGGNATAADAIAHETARFGKIMQKNMSKLKEKAEADGFAPMDMIVNIKGTKNTANPSPPRTKYSSTGASRKKRKEQDVQSSEDDDNSSEEDESAYSKSKQKVPSQRRKKAPETKSRTTEATNKENNGTESTSSPDTKLSLGSLSSTSASLGSSLATSDASDDNSIESVPVNLGKNHKKMTQYEKSSNLKDKLVTKPTAAKSSSKRRLKLDFNPALQSTQQSSSSSLLLNDDNKKGSNEKASRQKKLPSSPLLSSSDHDSSSSSSISSSRWPVKKQTKSAKLSSSSAKKRRPASSSDSVEIVSGNKSAKKRPSPPSDLSSSDDSDDDDDVARAKPRAKNDGEARLPTSSNSKLANNLGWTRGKAGWKKIGDDKSPGFSFMKAN